MKEIKLTQGKVALVDDEDYDYLMQWKWFAHKQKYTYYAGRTVNLGKKPNKTSKTIKMHVEIMQTPSGMECDHVDHDGLNNQRYNLRNATHAQNAQNRSSKSSGTSKFLGVVIRQKGVNKGRVIAQIKSNKRQIHIGSFKTEEDAARAYDIKAKELFGEFANLNFK